MDPTFLIIFALVVFAVVLGLAGVRAALARDADEVRVRVGRLVGTAAATPAAPQPQGTSIWAALLRPFSAIAKPRDGSEDLSKIRAQLTHADLRSPRAVEVYYGLKLFLALLFCGGVVGASSLMTSPLRKMETIAVVLAAVGYYAPSIWLSRRVARVQGELSRALPDALDLLTTCVEAGQGLEAALLRISRELGLAAPRLTRELELTLMEIQTGMVRSEAFRRLAQRTGLEDLKNLSAILIQTEMFGTSIARALRTHSSTMRVRRTHRAEEKAATVAVKMLLPLVFFILPSLVIVILGPAILRIMKTLMPALGGGQ
jgi:tight adherence protein C